MRRIAFFALPLLLTFSTAQGAQLPPDVTAYVARRDRCDHWRGEASDDPGRAAEIAQAVMRECRGSDPALARLLRRYSGNRPVMRRLDAYDRRIER